MLFELFVICCWFNSGLFSDMSCSLGRCCRLFSTSIYCSHRSICAFVIFPNYYVGYI